MKKGALFVGAALAPVAAHMIMTEKDAWALILVILALATDILDGWAARTFKKESALGKIIDPASDKIFVLATLYALFVRFHVPLTLLYVFLIRDCVLGVGTLFLWIKKRTTLSPSFMGKTAMGLNMISITMMITHRLWPFPAHGTMQWLFGIIFSSGILASCASFYYYAIDFVLILWNKKRLPDTIARFFTTVRLATVPLLGVCAYQQSKFWAGIVSLAHLALDGHRFKDKTPTEKALNLAADKGVILSLFWGSCLQPFDPVVGAGNNLRPLDGPLMAVSGMIFIGLGTGLFRLWKDKRPIPVTYFGQGALWMFAVGMMVDVIRHSALSPVLDTVDTDGIIAAFVVCFLLSLFALGWAYHKSKHDTLGKNNAEQKE